MKKILLFSCALQFLMLTAEAQSIHPGYDSIQLIRSIHKIISMLPDRPVAPKESKLFNAYLLDSTLSSRWDNVSNTWGNTAYSRSKIEYDVNGRPAVYNYYRWRSTTNEWVADEQYRINYNLNGDITDIFNDLYDSITFTWLPFEHDLYVYTNLNVPVSQTIQYYNKMNSSWFTGEFRNFNATGALVEEYYKNWDNASYVITSGYRYTYELNSMDKPNETLLQQFDTLTDNWVDYSRLLAQYTDDTILVKETNSLWSGDSWSYYSQDIYSYTDNRLSQKITGLWNAGISDWKDFSRENYLYNTNNLVAETLYQTLNSSTWENFEKTSWLYDDNNLISSKTRQYWYNNSWMNSSLNSYAYNANGQQTDVTFLSYDFTNGLIIDGFNFAYSYDINNLITQYIFRDWSPALYDLKNNYIRYYYFSVHNNIGLNTPNAEKVIFYPNPATNTLNICNIPPECCIHVYDLKGNILISRTAGFTIETIDISSLSNGEYLLGINDVKSGRTIKFIKQ